MSADNAKLIAELQQFRADYQIGPFKVGNHLPMRRELLDCIIAALSAQSEPTEAMIQAGNDALDYDADGPTNAIAIWNAMRAAHPVASNREVE